MADGENEIAMIRDMADAAGEALEAVGAKNIRTLAGPSAPRWAIHEVGIARMGTDPKKSVLNQFQQTHDIRNLWVMDVSGFTSSACQNPTLTIMALCARSCDYLMGEMKRGNIRDTGIFSRGIVRRAPGLSKEADPVRVHHTFHIRLGVAHLAK